MERYAPFAGGSMIEDPNGPLVKYDDAQRAVAEAEQRAVLNVGIIHASDRDAYEQGQRDMLDKAIAAVEALEPIYRAYPHRFVRVSDILAALRALPPDGGE